MRTQAVLLLLILLVASRVDAVVWPAPADDEVVGELIEDRLRGEQRPLDLARMHNIGHNEIRAANPDADPWLPAPGTTLRIPQLHVLPEGPREGIVVNLSERRLYFFTDDWPDRDGPVVDTHPVGVGLFERATPTVEARVSARLEDPAWYPNEPTRAFYAREGRTLPAMVPPGPENPLGRHALVLDRDGLLIHGTHRPDGVGLRVSQGCIRLYPESIASMLMQVPVGTPVRIVHQPVRFGWRGAQLYMEVDPADDEGPAPPDWEAVRARLMEKAAERPGVQVDLDRARQLYERADSVPGVVGAER